jgi:hypothetical protein
VYNVFEPCVSGRLLHNAIGDAKGPADLVAGIEEELGPLLEGSEEVSSVIYTLSHRYSLVLSHRLGVLTLQVDIGLDMLEPTTRLQKLEHLPIQLRLVIKGTMHIANMDKVERGRLKGPLQLSIVDLKLDIRRRPGRLSR